MVKEGLYSRKGYEFMAAAFEVHREQGGGLTEEIYQESLELELSSRGIPFQPKPVLRVFYKDRELKRKYVPDLVAFDRLIVELKAVSNLIPEHEAQILNYMRVTHSPVGYLLNFGPMQKLEWKRFVLSGFGETASGHLCLQPDGAGPVR
jgi:GxxExxY protein